MIFNDRRKANVNKKALKAANGPSLAPKGYKADKEGRKEVSKQAVVTPLSPKGTSNKQRYNTAAISVDRSGSANENDPWTAPNESKRRR